MLNTTRSHHGGIRKFINKHGVAILLNRRWTNQINLVQCACERVVALSNSVNKQPITLMSVYTPHRGYPDHHVEETYKTILTTIEKEKGMKIIGGDFNAELDPGEGLELSSVGHYTLNKANCRGERMTKWLHGGKLLKDTTAMTAEREALRLGVENLMTLFPAETKDFQFVVENESRETEYKVDIQSMRLLCLRNDHVKDVCVHRGISELKSKRRKTVAHAMPVQY